jgi:hypothetical protein
MKKYQPLIVSLTLIFTLLMSCESDSELRQLTYKFHPNDPFQKAIVSSQFFDIDSKKDNVVEGENGTVLVIPKGSFKNSKGKTVTANVKIELAEALSLDKMLLSNLTTTSNGKPLETDGMIYLNATSDGEQLSIDSNIPIYVEIPTRKRKPGMKVYKGLRDENGNMNWINPQDLASFLVSVDLDLLDFYPKGFETEVMAGLPFRNHQKATKKLIDSLYYSLTSSNGSELIDGLTGTEFNETYYNQKLTETTNNQDVSDQEFAADTSFICGIDPAIIKVIKSKPFQNSLISTREFELRLQRLFKTGSDEIIDIYIKNLDKDLWELDSMAASQLVDHPLYKEFHNFSLQKLTNVKDANKYAELLQTYYEAELVESKALLEATKDRYVEELQQKNAAAQKVVNEYKALLNEREKYRMETYGFKQTEMGWINIDIGTGEKDWAPIQFEIIVENGLDHDQVYTYVIYTSIKSLYRLNSNDKKQFYVGNEQQKEMLTPKKSLAIAIAIGYKEERLYLAFKEFETGSISELTLILEQSTLQDITLIANSYDGSLQENSINKDLEYMAFFAKEKKRQEKLKSERQYIERLWARAFPACFDQTSW